MTTYRDVLRNSEFRGLVVAQVASEWGDNIARVALASLVLARTDSAFLAVLAFVVRGAAVDDWMLVLFLCFSGILMAVY